MNANRTVEKLTSKKSLKNPPEQKDVPVSVHEWMRMNYPDDFESDSWAYSAADSDSINYYRTLHPNGQLAFTQNGAHWVWMEEMPA